MPQPHDLGINSWNRSDLRRDQASVDLHPDHAPADLHPDRAPADLHRDHAPVDLRRDQVVADLRPDQAPGPDAGLSQPILWLDAQDPAANGVPPSAGTLTTWVDKSPVGASFRVLEANRRPTLVCEPSLKRWVAYFDGDDTLLTDEAAYHFEGDSPFTVAAVVRTSATDCHALVARNQPQFPGTSYRGWQTHLCNGSMNITLTSFWSGAAADRRCPVIAPESTQFNTYFFVSTGTGSLDGLSVHQNGVELTAGCSNIDRTPGLISVAGLPTAIGSRHLGDAADTADSWLTGWIAEVRIYDRALDNAQRLALHNLLNAKWIAAAAPRCTP